MFVYVTSLYCHYPWWKRMHLAAFGELVYNFIHQGRACSGTKKFAGWVPALAIYWPFRTRHAGRPVSNSVKFRPASTLTTGNRLLSSAPVRVKSVSVKRTVFTA